MKRMMVLLTMTGVLLAGCGVEPGGTDAGASTEQARSGNPVVDTTPTTTLTATPTVLEKTPPSTTQTAEPTAPSVNAETLRQAWRPTIYQAFLLFETCTVMFETHFEYSQGEIGLGRALHELNAESDVLAFAWHGFTSGPVPSDATGPFMFRLEQQIMVLIELLDPIDEDAIGTPEVQETLFDVCAALKGLQSEIVSASLEAGLTEADVNEIHEEIAPLIEDLYEQVLGG